MDVIFYDEAGEIVRLNRSGVAKHTHFYLNQYVVA